MPFRIVGIAATILFGTLTLTLLFVPGVIYWLFAVEWHETADFLAKRAAMLFLGLAYLCFSTRDVRPSPDRRAIATSIAVALVGLAVIGAYEFVRGFAGAGVLLAVGGELAFAGAFLAIMRESGSRG